jgi:F0F1-type ATP synthase gamma subunit
VSRERVLFHRLRTLETLDAAVSALRTLSAQHFRVARALLPAARTYRDEITAALGVLQPAAPAEKPQETTPVGVVLIAADLGLVGDYCVRLVQEALELREERGRGPLFCLGHRALGALERRGARPDRVHSAPTSVGSLPNLLLPLVDEVIALRRTGELGPLWLVAARFAGAGHYHAVRVPVLPVVPAPTTPRLLASKYTETDHLRSVVVREYLYATLYEALLEALTAEHGRRLVTAETARSWLAERIAATRRLASAIRREASTQEILEVATAARAARHEKRGRGWMRRG